MALKSQTKTRLRLFFSKHFAEVLQNSYPILERKKSTIPESNLTKENKSNFVENIHLQFAQPFIVLHNCFDCCTVITRST